MSSVGVSFHAKGMPYEDWYDCGYITFAGYRMALARALDLEAGIAYTAWYGSTTDSRAKRPSFVGSVSEDLTGELTESDLLDIGFDSAELSSGIWRVSMQCETFERLMNERFTEEQQNLLFAPDNEGKWPWTECRDMYKAMCDVKVDFDGHNYGEVKMSANGFESRHYNMHEQFMSMMRYCWKRRVNLYWD